VGLGGRGFRSVALRRAEKEVFRKEVLGRRSELESEREREEGRNKRGVGKITSQVTLLDVLFTKYNLGHQIEGVEMGEHVARMKMC
jgi:hypothetical protein